MLWFQVKAVDSPWLRKPQRRRNNQAGARELARLPIRVNRSCRFWLLAIRLLSAILAILLLTPHASGQSKGRKGKPRAKASPTASPGEQSLTNIPLPIGHE